MDRRQYEFIDSDKYCQEATEKLLLRRYTANGKLTATKRAVPVETAPDL